MIWGQSGYFLTFCLVGRKNAISHCINIQLVNFVFIERSTRLEYFLIHVYRGLQEKSPITCICAMPLARI